MTHRNTPFSERLAAARQLIARGARPAPVHEADQFQAAGAEAGALTNRMGALASMLQPERSWRQQLDHDPSDEVRAYIVAAVLGCLADTCCHLRRGGPQPALALLPLRRIVCTRCAGIVRRPPADESDMCDVCQTRGVVTFVPFACRLGPTIVSGDACAGCASVLGIVREVSA